MLVGGDSVATPRPVTLGALVGASWIVTSGLKPGDKVMVNGLQKVRPGAKVTVTPPGPVRPPSGQGVGANQAARR